MLLERYLDFVRTVRSDRSMLACSLLSIRLAWILTYGNVIMMLVLIKTWRAGRYSLEHEEKERNTTDLEERLSNLIPFCMVSFIVASALHFIAASHKSKWHQQDLHEG